MHIGKTDTLFKVKQVDIKIIYTCYDISHDISHYEYKRKAFPQSVNKKASMKNILALEVIKDCKAVS